MALNETFDGFYTLLVSTADRSRCCATPIACKPAIIAETARWVAMASEYRALAGLPGVDGRADLRTGTRRGVRMASVEAAPAVTIDLGALGTRRINELHASPGAPKALTITNPHGAHALACGLDGDLEVTIEGHVGYYCAGMNKHAGVTINGNAGVGVAENMMSGRSGSPVTRPSRRARPRTADCS